MSWPIPSDYQEAIQNPGLCFADEELRRGHPDLDKLGLPRPRSGMFASVYQMECNGHKRAVRCFLRDIPDRKRRYMAISQHLDTCNLPSMVVFAFLEKGIKVKGEWYPVLKMEWIEGELLNRYIERNLATPNALRDLARHWLEVVVALKQSGIAHGDLQHGNILVVNGDLRLVDYDGMYVPGLASEKSCEVGHPNYQHPRRTEEDFGPYLDNFSAWAIYVSLIALSIDASLWKRLDAGDECLLFRRKDFENPETSQALRLLEHNSNLGVQSLAQFFRWLLYLAPSKVPSLDQGQIPPDVSGVFGPSQPDWLSDYVLVPVPDPLGACWVLDHIQLASPARDVRITGSCLSERLVVLTFTLSVFVLAGLMAPLAAAILAVIELPVLLYLFSRRFVSIPTVKEKIALSSRLKQMEREVARVEAVVNRLAHEKTTIAQDRQKKLDELARMRSECEPKERREIETIERVLHTTLGKLGDQRRALEQREANELAQLLSSLQSQFLSFRLMRYELADASIPGIGPKLTDRLRVQGFRTAADIGGMSTQQVGGGWSYSYTRTVAYIEKPGVGSIHVEGIGQEKAHSLVSWHQSIERSLKLRPDFPKSLPPTQEAVIKSKYHAQRQSLGLQESEAMHKASQEKDATRAKCLKEKSALTDQIRALQQKGEKELWELDKKIAEQRALSFPKQWESRRLRHALDAYRSVTFARYLKRILFFPGSA